MGASLKPIQVQIHEHRAMWQELWWNMGSGEVTAYMDIKKMDVFEFYSFFDKWREKNKREAEMVKQHKQQLKTK